MKRRRRKQESEKHNKRSAKIGLPPGSAVRVGRDVEAATSNLQLFIYDQGSLEQISLNKFGDLGRLDPDRRYWLNIDEIDDIELIQAIGKRFGLHPLLQEDLLNTEHRPKIEEFDEHIFVVLKMITLHPQENLLHSEQISLVLGKNYVISFQERPGDVLEPVRERLRNGFGRVRKSGSDYLLYALIDLIVDHYFLTIETLSERIDDLETLIVHQPTEQHLYDILEMRSLLIRIRRSANPTQELAGKVDKISSSLLTEETRRFFNDIRDHALHVSDSITVFRDTLTGLEQTYHAMVNLRTSKIVNLLTVVSAVFIPLTFIAGIYGMNFKNMPELEWQNGYFYALGAMGMIAVVLLLFFWRKRWL